MVAKVDPSLKPVRLFRWTVEKYDRMVELGILTKEHRVELIEGQIVEMAPIGPGHAYWVDRLVQAFVTQLGDRAVVRPQGPVRLFPRSEPEPDLAILRGPHERYREKHPGPEDVLLVIEVADSSLAYDRDVKAGMYARHGIPELWIWDVQGEAVEVYQDPGPEGYRSVRRAARDETLEPLALPGIRINFADLW